MLAPTFIQKKPLIFYCFTPGSLWHWCTDLWSPEQIQTTISGKTKILLAKDADTLNSVVVAMLKYVFLFLHWAKGSKAFAVFLRPMPIWSFEPKDCEPNETRPASALEEPAPKPEWAPQRRNSRKTRGACQMLKRENRLPVRRQSSYQQFYYEKMSDSYILKYLLKALPFIVYLIWSKTLT